jgi:hypothetical protein
VWGQAQTVGEFMEELKGNEFFQQYLDKITEKGFFKGVEPGSRGTMQSCG